MTMRIQPSILSADFVNFESEFSTISAADGIHVDVMDGVFVPNISFGFPVLQAIRQHTTKFIDVHLMIENPEHWAVLYAGTGVFSTTIHFEASSDPLATAKAIRATGSRAGLSIKPNTPVSEIEDLLEHFDQVLVMSVEPGFGGQAFMPAALEKISTLRKLVDFKDLSTWIQVDGGIDLATIELAASAGADTFVAGSSVFNSADRNSMIDQLRSTAQSAVPSF